MTPPAPSTPTPRQFLLGAALAMITMTIWSGWNVMSRMGVNEALAPVDIVFVRFVVAGLLAFPLFVKLWPSMKQIPKRYMLLMICGSGAPYVMLASFGFEHAPASHGVLIPGFMLLCVAVLSRIFLKESLNRMRVLGYSLIAATVGYRLFSHAGGIEYLLSDGWFMSAGVFWAVYTIVNKYTGIKPLEALALVSVGSLMGFAPAYLFFFADHIAHMPLVPALKQASYQGIVVSFIAFACYNRAIGLIGPSRASAFAAAIPLLTALMAVPLLGEHPSESDKWFIGLLTFGVLMATGVLRRLLGLKA